MGETIKKMACIALIIVGLPLVVTLLFQGSRLLPEYEELSTEDNSRQDEDLLAVFVGILAREMPADYEEEALKAQAILVRTNYQYALEQGNEPEQGLDTLQMQELFGRESYADYYGKLESCVKQTEGLVLLYQGELVQCPFCAVSSGYTRAAQGGQDYLKSVESKVDVRSEDYLRVTFYDKDEFIRLALQKYPEAELTQDTLMEQLVIAEREDSGYVKTLQLGNLSVDGEEFRNTFGWNSSAFFIKEVDGRIRVVTKGLGHGYGMSCFGANEMAKEGSTAEEILQYYFSDMELTTLP
ncbi:MAG: SpoIID/LytB domain-containing protein [Roseburia sp.]